MAENHYVDPVDQTQAAEGAPTHSELTTLYPNVVKEELGQWMQEDERQAILSRERDNVVTGLRRYAIVVGLSISMPVVLGALILQLAQLHVTPGDIFALLFVGLFAVGGWLALTYTLFRWVGKTFRNHTVQALPIVLTTLLCQFILIMPIFHQVTNRVGGNEGYLLSLVILLLSGTFVATVLILLWTAVKIPSLVKIVVAVLFFGAAVAAGYLL